MADKSGQRTQFERGVEQAIVALKKGAHLLKCGRRGKPKFCPFRLSTDEKSLIWYSGEKEKCLKLNTVSKINLGQKTVNFFRQPQPEKESQSFSLIYQNSERSLDLICKDKEQAECWVLGLTSLLSISHHPRHLAYVRTGRAASSCVNSPVSHLSTKYKLKLVHDSSQLPQVYSVYGSPPRKLREKYVSDGFLDTSDILYSLKPRTLSNAQHLFDEKFPLFSPTISDGFKCTKDCCQKMEQTVSSPENGDSLKDVFMWGEGVGVFFGDRSNSFETNGIKSDILLPRLLESTRMLDIESISCGDKYAALVTKQGEVFCWGEGIGGKLGHKVNLDVTYPKAIESLSSFCMQEIACGSTQTCAITRSGELYTWGKDRLFEGGNRSHWIPHRISCFGEIKISKVACGEWHTAIVSSSGHLFTYGEGTFGALGHGNLQSSSQPKEVESLKGLRVKSVACGPWHTAAIVEVIISRFKSNALNGKLFTWGDSDKGKLGHEDKKRKLLPTCIASLVDYDFVQVSCGRSLTVALTATGLVITMGTKDFSIWSKVPELHRNGYMQRIHALEHNLTSKGPLGEINDLHFYSKCEPNTCTAENLEISFKTDSLSSGKRVIQVKEALVFEEGCSKTLESGQVPGCDGEYHAKFFSKVSPQNQRAFYNQSNTFSDSVFSGKHKPYPFSDGIFSDRYKSCANSSILTVRDEHNVTEAPKETHSSLIPVSTEIDEAIEEKSPGGVASTSIMNQCKVDTSIKKDSMGINHCTEIITWESVKKKQNQSEIEFVKNCLHTDDEKDPLLSRTVSKISSQHSTRVIQEDLTDRIEVAVATREEAENAAENLDNCITVKPDPEVIENGTAQMGTDKFLKYTFQRKRKRGCSPIKNEIVFPEKKSTLKPKPMEKQTSLPVPSNSSVVTDLPRNNRRVVQVARQLISLSEKRW